MSALQIPVTVDSVVARIEELDIAWADFVAWSENAQLTSGRPPRDWQRYIANHVIACVRLVGSDAEDLLSAIATGATR